MKNSWLHHKVVSVNDSIDIIRITRKYYADQFPSDAIGMIEITDSTKKALEARFGPLPNPAVADKKTPVKFGDVPANILANHIEKKATLKETNVPGEIETIFHIHKGGPQDIGKQKPANYKQMMIGEDPFANVKMLIISVMREQRHLKIANPHSTVTLWQIWKEQEHLLKNDPIALQLNSMFYKGIEYEFFTEIDSWIKHMDLATKNGELDVAQPNRNKLGDSNQGDIRHDDAVLLQSLFEDVAERHLLKQISTPGYDEKKVALSLMIARAETPSNEKLGALFVSYFDKDNLVHINVLQSILGEWMPDADNPEMINARLALENYITTLKQGQQHQVSNSSVKVGQIVRFDAEVFRAIIAKHQGDRGMETAQGCGGFTYNHALFKTLTTSFNLAPEARTDQTQTISERALTTGAALLGTVAFNVVLQAGITGTNNALALDSSFADFLTYDVLKPVASVVAFAAVLPWSQKWLEHKATTSRIEEGLIYFEKAKLVVNKDPEHTNIEDHEWTIKAITSMTGLSKQALTELFTTNAEPELAVLFRTQLFRWIGAKIAEIRKLTEAKNYSEAIMLTRNLRTEIHTMMTQELKDKIEENKIALMGSYLLRFPNSILLFTYTGTSIFSFYSGIMPEMFSPYGAVGLFSLAALTEFSLIKHTVNNAYESVGNPKEASSVAWARFLGFCLDSNAGMRKSLTSIVQADFIQTISNEFSKRVDHGDFATRLTDVAKYWGDHIPFSQTTKEKILALYGKDSPLLTRYIKDPKAETWSVAHIGSDIARESIMTRNEKFSGQELSQNNLNYLLEAGYLKKVYSWALKGPGYELIRESVGYQGKTVKGFMSSRSRFLDTVLMDEKMSKYPLADRKANANTMFDFLEKFEKRNVYEMYTTHLNNMKNDGLNYKHADKSTWSRKKERVNLGYESFQNSKPRWTLLSASTFFIVSGVAFAPPTVILAAAGLASAGALAILLRNLGQYRNVIHMIHDNLKQLDKLNDEASIAMYQKKNKWAHVASNISWATGGVLIASSAVILYPFLTPLMIGLGVPVMYFTYRLDKEAYANIQKHLFSKSIGGAQGYEIEAIMKAQAKAALPKKEARRKS